MAQKFLSRRLRQYFDEVKMTDKNHLLKQVKATIEKYAMVKPKERILVAVSGGPDSICLLSVLDQLKAEYKIKLFAFHLNHQLRGGESNRDEQFVKEFTKGLKISCRVQRVPIKEYAKRHHLSLEQAAREVRYQKLEAARKRFKCHKIALGHNANDNVETIILNLVRGAGLVGLCGIPPSRDRIIRPLIETERKDILKYLVDNRISYRIDSSNLLTKIPRNFIRAKIIPLLTELNPNLIETITKVSAILREEDNYLRFLVDEIKKKVICEQTETSLTLDKPALLSYNLALRRRILKSILPNLDYDKIEKILAMIEKKTVGLVTLAKDLVASKEYDKIYLGPPLPEPKNQRIPVPIPARIGTKKLVVKEMGIEIKTQLSNDLKLITKRSNTEIFDFAKLSPPFYLRFRKPGDRFTPFGGKEKKLKEVLIDDKIPKRVRARLPLFCDASGILWIMGGRRAERARITTETKRFLAVSLKQWKNRVQKVG